MSAATCCYQRALYDPYGSPPCYVCHRCGTYSIPQVEPDGGEKGVSLGYRRPTTRAGRAIEAEDSRAYLKETR